MGWKKPIEGETCMEISRERYHAEKVRGTWEKFFEAETRGQLIVLPPGQDDRTMPAVLLDLMCFAEYNGNFEASLAQAKHWYEETKKIRGV
jgi:hypothetical protein